MIILRIIAAALLIAVEAPALPSQSKPVPCSSPEYRQLDFWIGDWDAFDYDNPHEASARTRVTRILDNCALLENYEGTNGLQGQSFTIYDSSRKIWHQTWVTDRGQLLVIEGILHGDELILTGTDTFKHVQVRGTWKPINGGVRETAVISSDQGKTWTSWFDIIFRPHAQANSSIDEKQVAALDIEYQAAVQKNDVATMDRLLADNFTLVTGSGKTYSKSDLLEEARGGRVQYERQDDFAQTVRVWGDTAVISATLSAKGVEGGKPFEYTVRFSDTYIRTTKGWQYVFGQSSLPVAVLPPP